MPLCLSVAVLTFSQTAFLHLPIGSHGATASCRRAIMQSRTLQTLIYRDIRKRAEEKVKTLQFNAASLIRNLSVHIPISCLFSLFLSFCLSFVVPRFFFTFSFFCERFRKETNEKKEYALFFSHSPFYLHQMRERMVAEVRRDVADAKALSLLPYLLRYHPVVPNFQ